MNEQTLDFFDVGVASSFEVPPQQAIDYFLRKGLKTSFSWQDVYGEMHDNAFTVAKMMDVDLLKEVYDQVNRAIQTGETLATFRKNLQPRLEAAGWWGVKEMVDPVTGEAVTVQLGSARRLETIFRTNIQSAYAAGAWQQIKEQAEDAPYLLYEAIDDFRTRPEHAAWDGTCLPVGSKFWNTHYPPNGWNCRCTVIQLDEDDLESFGIKVTKPLPKIDLRQWLNPRTGKTENVPNGIDPGFEFNPGKKYAQNLRGLLDQKVSKLPLEAKKAAEKSITAMEAASVDPAKFKAFKSVSDAENWLRSQDFKPEVNFGKVALDVVNPVLESVYNHLKQFPELKRSLGFIGSTQARNNAIYKIDYDNFVRIAEEKYPDRDSREIAKKWTRKQRTSGEWAIAFGRGMAGGRYGKFGYGVSFNEVKASAKGLKEFDAGLKRSLDSQFHPIGCDTYKSVMDHELGHSLDYLLNLRTDSEVVALHRQWNGDKAALSAYARQNIAEFIAEAWAEYLNNPKPREISRRIGEIVNARYKKTFG